MTQRLFSNWYCIDERSVVAFQIDDPERLPFTFDHTMSSRDGVVVDADHVGRLTADRGFLFSQSESRSLGWTRDSDESCGCRHERCQLRQSGVSIMTYLLRTRTSS